MLKFILNPERVTKLSFAPYSLSLSPFLSSFHFHILCFARMIGSRRELVNEL